jgi:PAS domain S-box-containing protein
MPIVHSRRLRVALWFALAVLLLPAALSVLDLAHGDERAVLRLAALAVVAITLGVAIRRQAAFELRAREKEALDAALRASEAKYAGILSIAADAIISVNERQQILHFNHGAEQIFGWPADKAIGQQINFLIPERYRTAHPGHMEAFARSDVVARRMGERGEIFGLRRDGTEFPAEASISKLNTPEGLLFTVVLRDTTERKRALQARDEVLGVVSHDLRNPIAAISMCARRLQTDPPEQESERRELLATIQESTAWVNRLIQDLLDVANIEQGRLSLDVGECDPAVILERAQHLFQVEAAEQRLALTCEVSPSLPAVHADGERIVQVLANLLRNAIKFTPSGGRITVAAMRDGGAVTFSVTDTGRGIPAEHLTRIFDRYWQSSNGARARGTGLGLSIAKGIVEAHGGSIAVRSTPGTGTTVQFTIPE